jgi:hypothetical protein
MTIGKKRLQFCFTVELDLAGADRLQAALSEAPRRLWLRNRIEAALERFLAWVTEVDAWRVKVISGGVREVPDPDAPAPGYEVSGGGR